MSCDLADARRCCRPASEAQLLAGQHVFDAVREWCRSDGKNPSDGGLSQLPTDSWLLSCLIDWRMRT
eukprot:1298493-Amphidinium_carterae.1